MTADSLRLFSRREKLFGGSLGVLSTLLPHLLVDAPLMSKGIDDPSVTRAPEHVLHRHDHTRTSGDSALHDCIGVVHHQRNAHTRSAQRLRHLARAAFFLRKLVTEEELVSVENDLAVQDSLAIRRHHGFALFTSEHLFVELKSGQAVADNQMRNKLVFAMHCLLHPSRALFNRPDDDERQAFQAAGWYHSRSRIQSPLRPPYRPPTRRGQARLRQPVER